IRDRNVTGVQTCALPILLNNILSLMPCSNGRWHRYSSVSWNAKWEDCIPNCIDILYIGSKVIVYLNVAIVIKIDRVFQPISIWLNTNCNNDTISSNITLISLNCIDLSIANKASNFSVHSQVNTMISQFFFK